MKINDLFEARRNPDHPAQKRSSVIDQLMKYNGDDSIYISFTELKKIGINPTSSYATPNGVYCYKLNDYIEDIYEKGIARAIPYAYDAPYINILKQTQPLLDVTKYSQEMYESDIEKISNFLNLDDDLTYQLKTNPVSSRMKTVYYYKYLNQAMTILINKLDLDTDFYGAHKAKILRKLGYNGLYDSGAGIIHNSEPAQAVFFTKDSYKLIERIYNKVDARDIDVDSNMVTTIQTSKGNIRKAYKDNPSIFLNLLNGPNKNNIPLDVVRNWISANPNSAKHYLGKTKYARLLDENK